MAKLRATVRTVSSGPCTGPDVPAFWKSLGFVTQHQLVKEGHTVDVQRGPWTVHVLVSRLLRRAHDGGDGGDMDLVPGLLLVEAWTEVGAGSHTDAIAALMEVGKLLGREGVALEKLPEQPKGGRRPLQSPA